MRVRNGRDLSIQTSEGCAVQLSTAKVQMGVCSELGFYIQMCSISAGLVA